jgi:GH15 family glucan-1,4-alpha-glucosidase
MIGDCHSAALVSGQGSIDWCCMPRFDAGSLFGRLPDWENGGFCSIRPAVSEGEISSSRRYLEGTLILETTFHAGGDEARMIDCFTTREGGARDPYRQILRVLEGVRGRMDFHIVICPRFDYGDVKPWIRRHGPHTHSAIGGNDALLITGDLELEILDHHDLEAVVRVRPGERLRLSLEYLPPEEMDRGPPPAAPAAELDARLDFTTAWWRKWSQGFDPPDAMDESVHRSLITLKAMTNAPTGAMVAAPSTSLPEVVGGERNWDYRYSWVRDSSFAARSLAEMGYEAEADGFRRFIERSAAGSADDLRIAYGVGGERRLGEQTLDALEGYRQSRPVRVGNQAARQTQLDAFGELVNLTWLWHLRGFSPDDDYWRFLGTLVEAACERWQEPDHGIWEIRGEPRHFVHSKAMCWVAVARGLDLARECARKAPERRWRKAAAEIRDAVESEGFDRSVGSFVQTFGSTELDAAVLLLPSVGFVDYRDPRMVSSVRRIRERLSDEGGFLRRYETDDGISGREGVFLPCTFWLVDCLARQNRQEEARSLYDQAVATANDVGLFAEEYDPRRGEMLGNFPQALTHLSHITAAVALAERSDE